MRQGFGSKVAVTTAVTLSTGSILLGYWLLRRFRRRLNQSQFLRNGPISHPDATKLALGDYVRVRGTVSAGARTLTSPLKGVPCVAYRVNVVRVVDSRYAKEKASVTGIWGSLGGLSSFIPWLFSFTSTAEVEKERWDTVYQVISTQGETVEIYLDMPEPFANLEAVAHAGIGTRRPRVRVDLASAEFFSMEEVMSDFKADESMESKPSSRTHLGYKTTEEVLAVGSKITVLGEVGPDPEGAQGDVLLRKASPASIFDLKTASISRPFVVSTKTEQALLKEIEGSGRAYFWLAMPSIVVGLALAYFSVVRVVAAVDDRRPFEGHRATAAVAGRSVSEPPRGLFRWRRTELH